MDRPLSWHILFSSVVKKEALRLADENTAGGDLVIPRKKKSQSFTEPQNIEQGISNFEHRVQSPSEFEIPCSIFVTKHSVTPSEVLRFGLDVQRWLTPPPKFCRPVLQAIRKIQRTSALLYQTILHTYSAGEPNILTPTVSTIFAYRCVSPVCTVRT